MYEVINGTKSMGVWKLWPRAVENLRKAGFTVRACCS